MRLFKYAIAILTMLGVSTAFGASQGGWNMGANLGFINASQEDMNKEIDASVSGASKFGNAWEANIHLGYRMSGSIGLSIRPSYFFYGEEKGTATAYSMSGFTFFPMLKWYMLEDQTIKFYSQYGIGYGQMSGSIEKGGEVVEFSGGNLGYQAGLGAEFCFGGGHCVNVEGSIRALYVERFLVDKGTGALTGTTVDQSTKGKELEVNGRDFAGSMSGILGMVGYILYF